MTFIALNDPSADMPPWLLLLPGFLLSSTAWKPVENHSASNATVFSCDLPGFGSRVPQPTDYSLESLVAAVHSKIRGFDRTPTVGHSIGGITRLALAQHYPRVKGISALDFPVFRDPGEGTAYIGRQGTVFRALLAHGELARAGCAAARTVPRAWVPAARRRWRQQPEEVFRSAPVHSQAAHHSAVNEIIIGGHVARPAPQTQTRPFQRYGNADTSASVSNVRAISAAHRRELSVVEDGAHQLHLDESGLVAARIRRNAFSIEGRKNQ